MKRNVKNQLLMTGLAGLLAVTTLPLSVQAADNTYRRSTLGSVNDTVGMERLNRIIGSQVLSSDRQKVGTVNNLILDLESGHVLFAVVSLGSSGRVAIPPGVITEARANTVYLNIPKDKVESAPRIEGQMTREMVSQASFVNRVYQAFNQPAWWQGSTPVDQGTFHNVHAGENLIGMPVRNVQDQLVGDIRNAIIDIPAGRILYLVMEPRSDIASTDKLYAFPPSALTSYKDGKSLATDIDKEKIVGAPSFPKNDWPSLSDRSFASRVYQHFGKQAYFDSSKSAFGGLRSTGSSSERVYGTQDNTYNNSSSSSSSDLNSQRDQLQREREQLQREREQLQRERDSSRSDSFDRYQGN